MRHDLYKAAEEGTLDKVPREYFTLKDLLSDYQGETVFHIAARNGFLKQIPKQYVTEDTLARTNASGITSFHSAAMGGNLDKIPKEWLTEENLNMVEWELKGDNCFHSAARGGKLGEIPKKFLTPKNLLKENLQGKSALFIALQKEEDITGKEGSAGLINPQTWIPYLQKLKETQERLDVMSRNPRGLTDFIEKVKARKMVGEMESLKI